MKNEIISFLFFNSAEEFEQWQLETDEPRKVFSIIPVTVSVQGNQKELNTMDFGTNIKFFVQYWKEVESNP